MRPTPRDVLASVLVAAVVVIYAAYLAFDGVPLVRDASGMAAVGLVLGIASRRIGERHVFSRERLAFAGGLGSTALGVATLVTESDAILAVFIASIVALCAAALYVSARASAPGRRVPIAP